MNACRVCGCSDFDACVTESQDGSQYACSWVEGDLCSACAEDLELDQVPVGEYL